MAILRAVTSAALLLFLSLVTTAQTPAVQPTSTANPKFTDALREGGKFLHQERFAFAEDDFKKANKIAGGSCVECLSGLYTAQFGEGDYKAAMATADLLVTLAANPIDKSIALVKRGDAILAKAGKKPKPEQLEAAQDAYAAALASYPRNPNALFRDGEVLARLNKMSDASASFAKCASCVPENDPARMRAEHFAEDPSLSLKPRAPAFAVTTLDGSHFNLDSMGGRVVLIDFWATWCGPCNEALPEIKKIAKEFANEPLVILSVSWDKDDDKWKAFIQKNGMTWMQYRDADQSLTRAFGVEAIPHYFTIDADGVLTSEMLGENSDVEGKLKKLLAKAHQAEKLHEAAAPTSSASPGN